MWLLWVNCEKSNNSTVSKWQLIEFSKGKVNIGITHVRLKTNPPDTCTWSHLTYFCLFATIEKVEG